MMAHNGSFSVLTAVFMIILCRVSGVIMVSPGLGEATAPMRIRAGLCIAVSLVLLPVVYTKLSIVSGEAVRMPAMLMKIIASEVLVGIFLGLLARILCDSLAIAGQMISIFTGMSSVVQQDPQLGSGSTAISHLFSSLSPVVIFTTGLYAFPLFALEGSYNIFPVENLSHLVVNDMTAHMTHIIATSFRIAMELAAPYVLLGTLWPAMLGILNRLMPSIQVYSLAIPAQILGGILLLSILCQILIGTWVEKLQINFIHLPGIGG